MTQPTPEQRLDKIEEALSEQKIRCATCAATLPQKFDMLDQRLSELHRSVDSISTKLFKNGAMTRLRVIETKLDLLRVIGLPVVLTVLGLLFHAAYEFFANRGTP